MEPTSRPSFLEATQRLEAILEQQLRAPGDFAPGAALQGEGRTGASPSKSSEDPAYNGRHHWGDITFALVLLGGWGGAVHASLVVFLILWPTPAS